METEDPATTVWTRNSASVEKRDLWTAMRHGFRGRCPRCGQGKLFRAFLKVGDRCSVCGLDFTPHRADDLPAYLVIIIVGHIVVPSALLIETDFSPPVWQRVARQFCTNQETAFIVKGHVIREQPGPPSAHAQKRTKVP